MSFSWKGLLGVNASSPASSQQPASTQSNAAPAAAAASSPVGSGTGGATTPASTQNANASMTVASSANSTASSAQAAVPTVPLFSGMIPTATHHSTSFIPSSSANQQSPVNRAPSEVPINLVEGGTLLLGMENFGNTCYVNSMLQSLYFCRPFRDSVLSYKEFESTKSTVAPISDTSTDLEDGLPPPDTLFASLRDLFDVIKQSGQPPAVSSPTRSIPVSSLPAASPISTSQPSSANGDSTTNVSRRTSILGRPVSGNAAAAKASAQSASVINTNGSHTTSAIPIPSASTVNGGPPTLSVSTASTGSHTPPSAVDTAAVKGFIGTLKRENVLFDSTMHQDAHEMLNFVLNKVGEDLIDADRSKHKVKMQSRNPYLKNRSTSERTVQTGKRVNVRDVGADGNTCVHRLFEGVLTNETRCLTCETVTSRDECFLDLSIDIEQHSSVTSCLRQFSASEMLQSRNKFFCDSCSGLQEAEKRMKIKKLPNVLALHLKRFKYEETVQRYVKLAYRVAFPLELRLFNTSDDAEDPDRLYELFAIVVHIGAGPHHGHYIAVVKVGQRWVQFDDDSVSYIDEEEIQKYYGDRPGLGSAYVLFYQAVDLDFQGLGLEEPVPTPAVPTASQIERGRLLLGVAEASLSRNGLSPERPGNTANRLRLGQTNTAAVPSTATPAEGSSGGWFGGFRNRDKRSASQSHRRPNLSDSTTNASTDPSEADGLSGVTEGASNASTSPALSEAVGNASFASSALPQSEKTPKTIGSQTTAESPSEAKLDRLVSAHADANPESTSLRGSVQRRLRAASEGFSSANSSPAPTSGLAPTSRNLVSEPHEASASLTDGTDMQYTSSQPSFAPLDRPISKKEQKASGKSGRRTSSLFVSSTSSTGEKKEGMLSNLFASSSTQDKTKRNSSVQSSTAASTGSATPADDSNSSSGHAHPARKPSISTKSLSKTFGFGRK